MQIRRLWHYFLGIICAILFNGLLILLLIIASPRKKQEPIKKPASYFGWLKLSQANEPAHFTAPITKSSPQEKKTALLCLNDPQQMLVSPEIILSQKFEAPAALSLEMADFFQRGNEILIQFSAPSLTDKNAVSKKEDPNKIKLLDPAQFYYKKAVQHLNVYREVMCKKYLKLCKARGERPKTHPEASITINKDGKLLDVSLEKSSGSPTYDKYCIQSIKQSAPFPRIPNYLKTNNLIMSI